MLRRTAHLTHYTLDLHYSDPDRLVVTFEPAGGAYLRPNRTRAGWGVAWLVRQGLSVLAVKPMALDWYRKPDLHRFMRQLQQAGFFAGFRQVVFYGASMGGFGALAFADVAPGAIVLAYSPQSTLIPEATPWDRRFPHGKAEDWSGDFADGASCGTASRVIVLYDPLNPNDRKHVQRLPQHNLLALKFPAGGHLVATRISELRALSTVFRATLDGSLTREGFAKLARRRRELVHYWLVLARHARSWPMAEACWQQAAAIAPASDPVSFICAYLAHRWARWDAAAELLSAALAKKPHDAWLHQALAETMVQLNRPAEAMRYAEAGLLLKPSNIKLRRLLDRLHQLTHLPMAPTKTP